ncbi:hypothetical protein SAMN02745121_07677 [Nannocystis exedens]|uniref:Uncharacterized protein n=1 Tax=Nannocystis exedens TaxID=54 RepID=A0A1I2H696_9BACT|nr:hypothetical protein [Nannocystis exedens]PCC74036.1 hypothetical protein NAEX_07125 [Nannocystis exedens]SFF24296.1 hypothetical protein SAMN02745121_07677 [Nannocystis exedens]
MVAPDVVALREIEPASNDGHESMHCELEEPVDVAVADLGVIRERGASVAV